MAGLAELAAVMMQTSQRRIEATASNVGNLNTPGFRARRSFEVLLDQTSSVRANSLPVSTTAIARRTSPPALKVTGRALDIAVSPPASLLLRAGDELFAASSAQLRRGAEGQLIDAMGRVLQAAGGGDLVIGEGTPVILRDGTVLVDGRPEARVGMFQLGEAGEGAAVRGLSPGAAAEPAMEAVLHQGAVIPSDVDLAAEMVELAHAGRSAETGARIFQIYDELLGKASSTLAGAGQ